MTTHFKTHYECTIVSEEWWFTDLVMHLYFSYPIYYITRFSMFKSILKDKYIFLFLFNVAFGFWLNTLLQGLLQDASPCPVTPDKLANPLYETQIAFQHAIFIVFNRWLFDTPFTYYSFLDVFVAPVFVCTVAVASNNARIDQALSGAMIGVFLGASIPLILKIFMLNLKIIKWETCPSAGGQV